MYNWNTAQKPILNNYSIYLFSKSNMFKLWVRAVGALPVFIRKMKIPHVGQRDNDIAPRKHSNYQSPTQALQEVGCIKSVA